MAVPEAEPLVTAEGVDVFLGGLPILRDINLHVHAGEAVAIVGPNGSGKTTLLRTLAALTPFQQGSIELFGTPLRRFRDWHRVGYVPQHATLNRARWPFAPLSGGQKQRVLIARALATQPDLLIMDEPLAGVDLDGQAILARLLGELRDDGLGVILVLHELEAMATVLDRLIRMRDGQVAPHTDDLMQSPHARSFPPTPSGLKDPFEDNS